jgi:hypothetical protein
VNPAASNNKRLVPSSMRPGWKKTWPCSAAALDEDAVVHRLMFPKSLETRSLIGAW